MTAKSPLARTIVTLVLLAGSVLFLFPLIWMIATSVKPVSQAMENPPRLLPYPEAVRGNDNQLHPAVMYREPPSHAGDMPGDEKAVALLGRDGGQARIEVDAPGGKKVERVVAESEIRDPALFRWENYWKAITFKANELGFI